MHARAPGLDRGVRGGPFMRGQIVEDDDVAGPERGSVGAWGRGSAGARTWAAQAANHSPVIGPSSTSGAVIPDNRNAPTKVVVFQWPCGTAMRSLVAARRPAMQAGHFGARAGLVDKDQPPRIEIGLRAERGAAALQHVGAILLGGVARLFLLSDAATAEEAHSVATARPIPCAARPSRSSASVMSGVASCAAKIRAA